MLTWLFAALIWFGPPVAGWLIGRWWSVVAALGIPLGLVLFPELIDPNQDGSDDFYSFGVMILIAYTTASAAVGVLARRVKDRRRNAGGA